MNGNRYQIGAKPRGRTRCWSSLLVLMFFFVFSACGDEVDENIPAPKKTKVAKSKNTKSKAEKVIDGEDFDEMLRSYSYSAVGKRDPFASYIDQIRAGAQREDADRTKEQTEEFELDQYRLTGIVSGTSQPRALVEDPKGVGHTVRRGSRLGRNGGVITKIAAKSIVVTEEFRAPTGEKIRVPININLPENELQLGVNP